MNFLKKNWLPILLLIGAIYSFSGKGAYGTHLIDMQKYIIGFTEFILAVFMFWILNKKYK